MRPGTPTRGSAEPAEGVARSSGAPGVCPQEAAPALPVRRVMARWLAERRPGEPGWAAWSARAATPRAGRAPAPPVLRESGQGRGGVQARSAAPQPPTRPPSRRQVPRVLPRRAPRPQAVSEGRRLLFHRGGSRPARHSDSSRDPPPQSTRSVPRHGRPARFPRTGGKRRPEGGGGRRYADPGSDVTSRRRPPEAHLGIVGPCLGSSPNKPNSVSGNRQFFSTCFYY